MVDKGPIAAAIMRLCANKAMATQLEAISKRRNFRNKFHQVKHFRWLDPVELQLGGFSNFTLVFVVTDWPIWWRIVAAARQKKLRFIEA